MKRATLVLAALALLLGGVGQAKSTTIIASHQGDTDPLTEGFGTQTFGSPSTFGPLPNDLGLPAWQITGSAQISQFGYAAPDLTAAQQAGIASQGFTMTMVSRVLSNGLAPAYDSTNFVTTSGAHVNYNGRRWEIDLGLNSAGDTVVVLPTFIDNAGPGNSIRSLGPSFTLTGSGSSYHTYELVYNPVAQLADLYVDGVDRIQGYGGHTSFVGTSALVWGAFSGGEGNFNSVQLQIGVPSVATPEPASLTLLGGLGLGLAGYGWRRRKQATA